MHEKHIAREAYLKSPQRYTIGLFFQKVIDFKSEGVL